MRRRFVGGAALRADAGSSNFDSRFRVPAMRVSHASPGLPFLAPVNGDARAIRRSGTDSPERVSSLVLGNAGGVVVAGKDGSTPDCAPLPERAASDAIRANVTVPSGAAAMHRASLIRQEASATPMPQDRATSARTRDFCRDTLAGRRAHDDAHAPEQQTLAGGRTAIGLPATIEGAIRAGPMAADASMNPSMERR